MNYKSSPVHPLLYLLLVFLLAHGAWAATRTVSGCVLDGDGKPVKDGKLAYVTEPLTGLQTVDLDDTATFTFTIDAQAKLVLFASADGLAPVVQVVPADAPAAPLKIALPRGHRLEGTLLDETGTPVAGADITLGYDPTPGVSPPLVEYFSSMLPHTKSDDNGHFLLTGVPGDHMLAQINGASTAHTIITQAFPLDTPQTITLRRLAKITGRIVRQRDGKPVTEFAIAVRFGQLADNALGRAGGMMNTSADGSFLQYVDDGQQNTAPMTLVVESPGYMVMHVSCTPNSKPLTIRLPDAGKLTGRITEQGNGAPLAGVTVNTEINAADTASPLMTPQGNYVAPPITTTDADGKFTLPAQTPTVTVTLRKAGYARTLLRDVAPTAPLHVTLAKGATITGRALAEDGTPLPDVLVRVSSPNEAIDYFSGKPDADGSYRVTDLPGGNYVIREGDLRTTTVQVAAGQTVVVDWHRATAITLHGAVHLSESAASRVTISLTAADNSAFYETHTDANGEYRVSLLAPGSYSCAAHDKNYKLNTYQYLTIYADDNQYDINRRCAISGQLLDAQSGKPLAGMKLQAYLKSSVRDYFGLAQPMLFEQHLATRNWLPVNDTFTDAQGCFTLPNLLPGEWLIADETIGAQDNNRWQIFGAGLLPPLTLQQDEQKTGVIVRMPSFGTAEISAVDAETGKTIAGGARIVCEDQWGHLIFSDNDTNEHSSMPLPESATFSRLPAGEYRLRTLSFAGLMSLPENYLDASLPVTVTAGKTTSVQLPLQHGGRLQFTLKHPAKLPAHTQLVIQFTLSKPGSNEPTLSDVLGQYTGGGLLLSPEKPEAFLTLPPATYHLQLRTMTLPDTANAHALPLPLLTGPAVIDREVTIAPGKDMELTLPN